MSATTPLIETARAFRGDEGRLLPLRETVDGWHILTVHWSAVPDYDYKAACQGMSPEAIRRELEIDWSSTLGKRVYPEFARELHLSREPLPFDPRLPLYCGWDFGGTPAFCPTQLSAAGQWLVYPPLVPPAEQTWGIYEFAEQVADYLHRVYALPNGMSMDQLKLVHVGDPAGNMRLPRVGHAPRETATCFSILNRGVDLVIGTNKRGQPTIQQKPGWGWKVIPGAVNINERLESVRARLTTNLRQGVPSIVVCCTATTMVEGFLGGYAYKQRSDGRYEWDPDKNWYSHPFDALGYVATRLFARAKRRDDDDDEERERKRPIFQSQASRRALG